MGEPHRPVSFWLETCGDDLTPRAPLEGDAAVDVAIVGGGYTGLWTAYYLAAADPSARIAVLEAEICGFGASGRNGGWCSALFPAPWERVARLYGREAAVALREALEGSVDEVGRVCRAEGIDAHFVKGGALTLATAAAHVPRLQAAVEEDARWGVGSSWLAPAEVASRVRVAGCLGAVYFPHCAALHPGRLVRGLARAVERRGVSIHELTPVTAIGDRRVHTPRGTVSAQVVVRATEGYTARLPGHRRTLVPLYSLMIATEPLDPDLWAEIGWEGRETLTDGRHLIIYAQRTADGRIALGGRGAPYHFGSRTQEAFDRDERVFSELSRVLVSLFPALSGVRVTHRWGGTLGVPRDWFPSVGYDRARGLAWAGGYVGDGVAASNLAGRTLAELLTGERTALSALCWVGHRWRAWEPEPLRWAAINAALSAMARADAAEARTGRPSRRGRLVRRVVGAG